MISLNYKVFGEGEPVIILHGIFGMLDNWKTFGRELSKSYQVFLVDQRDHGRSPHTYKFTYPILAEDLHQFIEEHKLSNVKLIGHSMGGKTIMEFARKYPTAIDKMIVVDMGVKKYTGGHEYIIDALQSLPLDQVENRKDAEELLSLKIKSKGVVLFLMKNLSRKVEGGYEWKINLPLIAESYASLMAFDLTEVNVPSIETLFIKGGNSNYILEEDQKDILKVFPKGKIETVENAGHWVHAEQPKELLEMTTNFFNTSSL